MKMKMKFSIAVSILIAMFAIGATASTGNGYTKAATLSPDVGLINSINIDATAVTTAPEDIVANMARDVGTVGFSVNNTVVSNGAALREKVALAPDPDVGLITLINTTDVTPDLANDAVASPDVGGSANSANNYTDGYITTGIPPDARSVASIKN